MQSVIIIIIMIVWSVCLRNHTVQAGEKPIKLPIAIENFPPFEFEQNGEIVGVDTEIVRQVLKRLGYIPDIHVLPWTRAQNYAKRGTIAALYSLTKNPEREMFYYFSDPLNTVEDVFFKLSDRTISWTSLEDLKAYRVGVSQGYSYAPEFMEAVESRTFKKIESISGEAPELRQLKKIKAGRIDLCICEVSVCQYLIKKHAPEFDMIDYINRPIGEIRPYYIGFSKKWPGAEKLVREFNEELAKFIAEGGRKAIFEKYGVTKALDKY